MDIDRRISPRRVFGGVVEISAHHPRAYFVAQTTQVNESGCFVRTSQSLQVGTAITLKITHEGNEFNAAGKVVYAFPEKGLGISFTPATDADKSLLGKWISEADAE
jgi:hypothetical protein